MSFPPESQRFNFPRSCRSALPTLALGLLSSFGIGATERFDLRYAPGSGGGDMSAPADPGSYFQMPLLVYWGQVTTEVLVSQGAATLFTGSLAPMAAAFPSASATTPVSGKITVQAQALLPRWSYMSSEQWLGGTVGVTVMLPLLHKQLDTSLQVGGTTLAGIDATTISALSGGSMSLGGLSASVNSSVASAATAQADVASASRFGVGDLELSPLLRWSDGARQLIFAPTIVLPTGEYDASRVVNAGAGRFYTFRPTVQAGYIGDAWDFGIRASLAVNSRNKDTGYRSGNYINVDASVMRFLADGLRGGLAGYAVAQTTADRMDGTPNPEQSITVDRKGWVYGLGPGIAWIKGAGDMLLDARLIKEFGAVNRPEGTSFWLNLSFPLN